MHKTLTSWLSKALAALLVFCTGLAAAQTTSRVVDIPTRAGVTQRLLVLTPPEPKAVAILFAGGQGGLLLGASGDMQYGKGNFLIRARQLFVDQGLQVVIVDTPSDRQSPPYLGGFRQTPEHLADIKAVMAWTRAQNGLPVWLVGTSRGTQSAAAIAVATSSDKAAGPDGLVLTSTILTEERGNRSVPDMALDTLAIPVLVVHHEQDGCKNCAFSNVPAMMNKLTAAPRKQLLAFRGGSSRGDPCEAFAYHGYNGLEADVVAQTAQWMLAK
ncbi:MAG: alpha/beta hydrolase [Polaromonas sp.]